MRIAIIGGGGQVAEAIGAVLKQRGLDPQFYRPQWISIPGIPKRPRRAADRLQKLRVERTPNALIDSCQFSYSWQTDHDALRASDVFIFALPSYLAEHIGFSLASVLSGRVVINVSDRFLGTYALAVSASQIASLEPIRLGIAFNSPPLLAYQPERDSITRLYYQKPFVMMSCFPRSNVMEARAIVSDLFGLSAIQIRVVPSMVDLAFENVNSILHAVQDLENLQQHRYSKPGSLFDPDLYTDSMVQRICSLVQERDCVAKHFVRTVFRSLDTFDGTTFRDDRAQAASPFGTARYRHYHPLLTSIPRPMSYIAHGYEDVGWAMVPLESFARNVGVTTPVLSSLINEWNSFMRVNYRSVGRSVRSLRLLGRASAGQNPTTWDWRFEAYQSSSRAGQTGS